MPRLTIPIYKCDICFRESRRDEDTSEWLEFEIDGEEERTWVDKVICPYCLKAIKQQTERTYYEF